MPIRTEKHITRAMLRKVVNLYSLPLVALATLMWVVQSGAPPPIMLFGLLMLGPPLLGLARLEGCREGRFSPHPPDRRRNAVSEIVERRTKGFRRRFAVKDYRDQFVAYHAQTLLAHQVRGIRGNRSQDKFGAAIGMPQSVVSRLEDANYGKWTLQTLLAIAARTDRALIVRFAGFEEFAAEVLRPEHYDAPPAYDAAEQQMEAVKAHRPWIYVRDVCVTCGRTIERVPSPARQTDGETR